MNNLTKPYLSVTGCMRNATGFLTRLFSVKPRGIAIGGVRRREVERRPCNHEDPSSSPGSGSQLWDFSLAHTFRASTGVVPRKQNRERLV